MKLMPPSRSLTLAVGVAVFLAIILSAPLVLARSAARQAASPTPPARTVGSPSPATDGNRNPILGNGAAGPATRNAATSAAGPTVAATPDLRAGPPARGQGDRSAVAGGTVGAVTAQFVRPLLGAHVRAGEQITVTYNASAVAGLTSVQLWADGSLYAGYSDPTATLKSMSRTQHWSSPVPGRHALTVVARDAQGHASSTVPVIILVAGEPSPLMPEVNLLAPQAAARIRLGQSVPVTITASSPSGITRVEFWRDWGLAGLWQSTDSSGLQLAGFNLTWTPTITGTSTIWATAYDLAGQKAATQPITLTVYLPAQPAAPFTPPASPTVEATVPVPVPMSTFVPSATPTPEPTATPSPEPTIAESPTPEPGFDSPLPTPEAGFDSPLPTPDSGGTPPADQQDTSTPENNGDATPTPEYP